MRPGPVIHKELVEFMYDDYVRTGLIRYVADKYGCHHSTVVRRFKEFGLPLRPRSARATAAGSLKSAAEANHSRHVAALDSQIAAAEAALAVVSESVYRRVLSLRVEHPEATLAELGELHVPPLSKDAFWGRFRRALVSGGQG